MAFTYTGDPSNSSRDWVRWRIGDTDSTDPLLLDGEVDAAISEYGNKTVAASECARAIAAKFARKVDSKMGKLSLSLSQKAKHYRDLAKELRHESDMHVAPWAASISQARKEAQEEDTDRVVPAFAVGQFDVTPQDAAGIDSTGF